MLLNKKFSKELHDCHLYFQQHRSQTKKYVFSRYLKSPGSVTACKSFGSEFHADGPACEGVLADLVHNHSDHSHRCTQCLQSSSLGDIYNVPNTTHGKE